MKTTNLLLGLSLIVLFSCNESSEKNESNKTETILTPQTEKINGVFSVYFELVDKKYEYAISKPKDDLTLPSFEMDINFEVKNEFDYASETKNSAGNSSKYIFNLSFYDSDNNIIEPLTVNTNFEIVKYFVVKGIDFKELLNSSEGANLNYTFKTFIKKNNLDKINEAKSFKLEVFENTPEARLKNVSNSLDRASQISNAKLQGDIVIIEYKEQEHDDYWESGKKIQKALVGIPARIIMKLDFVNSVSLTIPFNDEIYTTNISKQDLEKYTGHTIEEIRDDWSIKFSDVYIYKLNNPKREAYFNKFVKVSEK